jgi:hypothetical protein
MSEQPKFHNKRDNVPDTPKLRMKKGESESDAIERFKSNDWELDGVEYYVLDNVVHAGKKPDNSDSGAE